MVLRHIYSSIAFLLFSLFTPATSQTSHTNATPNGITVLWVREGLPAAVAGIQPDDLITSWSQGTESGTIPSPFEFKVMERDRAPRPTTTTLTGQRSGRPMTWTLRQSDGWGILSGAGPALSNVSSAHDTIRDLGTEKKIDEIIMYCRQTCVSPTLDSEGKSWLLFAAGVWLNYYHRPDDAGEFFSTLLQDPPKTFPYAAIEAYGEWGDGYRSIQNWKAAGDLYAKALHESERINPRSLNVAFYLDKLAAMRYKTGGLLESSNLSQQALRIRRSLCPQCAQTISNLSFLGSCAIEGGDLDVAQAWLHQALQMTLQLKDDEQTAGIYNNLGAIAEKRGELADAETYLLLALDMHQSLHVDDSFIAGLWANLAVVAEAQGNFARAEQYSQRAVTLQEKAGPREEGDLSKTLNNLADIKLKSHHAEASAKLLTKALEIQTRLSPQSADLATTLTTYGMALAAQGSFDPALEQYHRALSIFEDINAQSLDSAECHYNLAELYTAKQEWADALEHHRIAEEIRASLAPKSIEHAESLGALAGLQIKLGHASLADQFYYQALSILDSQSSFLTTASHLSFAAAYARYYAEFVSLLIHQGDTHRAFEILERSRARTLLQRLTEQGMHIHGKIPAGILSKQHHIESVLTDLSSQRVRLLTQPPNSNILRQLDARIAQLTDEHGLLEERIRSKYRFPAPTPLTSSQLQKLLPSNTALLEYFLEDDHAYVFTVTDESISVHTLDSTITQLNLLVKSAYSKWSTPTAAGTEAETKLAEDLLDPVIPYIKAKRHLLLVTDGSLQYVAFSALPSPKRLSATQDSLIAHFTLQSLPSASFIYTLRKNQLRNPTPLNTIAILADPVFSLDDPRVQHTRPASDLSPTTRSVLPIPNRLPKTISIPRLIHSREEAEAIAEIGKNNQITLRLGFAATRETALSEAFTHSRISHYATHAIFDPVNPSVSGLIFSMVNRLGQPQSGFVTLQEIFDSRFTSDLIVLSSCQSAFGEDLSGGDGLMSLGYGFLSAGAHSILGTLWEVDDASISEFMRLFYNDLLRRGLQPAEALHNAQLAMSRSRNWSAPYHWAGFVIQGDPGR